MQLKSSAAPSKDGARSTGEVYDYSCMCAVSFMVHGPEERKCVERNGTVYAYAFNRRQTQNKSDSTGPIGPSHRIAAARSHTTQPVR